ncbi:MAG: DUF418 domain-containing protein [Candidatus Krumholzibacteriota bacterium]|nr:DUF418 domain-containing protein [Candidatus Krumholzibacteriota bacterium]
MNDLNDNTTVNVPVAPRERIAEIDTLRGFAMLGILIMNIQSFSMMSAAYLNPTAYGDLEGINRWVWILSHIFANMKFMTIFSMLFGAGIVLMTGRMEERGKSSAGIHYRRIFWLIVIGLIHAHLLWHGDILVPYALCGLLAWLFRRLSPGRLLWIGLAVVAVSSLLFIFFGITMPYWPKESVRGTMASWMPTAEQIAEDLANHRAGWLGQMAHRSSDSLKMETVYFVMGSAWRIGGLMLMGMAFFKWGILTGKRSARFYLSMAMTGLATGLTIVIFGLQKNFAAGWAMEYSFFLGSQFNYWGSILVSGGYIGIVMLACRSALLRGITSRLAAVGRMALTNYLSQTLICTTIFYGHGFGLYGSVERKWQIMIVFAIWILQFYLSPLWLKYFRFGPIEWVWRSLTYWKVQPMRQV